MSKCFCCLVITLLALSCGGCIPEDSIDWTDDGSLGLLKYEDVLALIDGDSGELTVIDRGELVMGPSITPDGKMIVWCKGVAHRNVDDLKGLVPDDMYTLVTATADALHQRAIREGKFQKEWLTEIVQQNYQITIHSDSLLADLIYRILGLQADAALEAVLKPDEKEILQKIRREGFTLCHLYLAEISGKGIVKQRTVFACPYQLMLPQISPNGQFVSFLLHDDREGDDAKYDLIVSAIDGSVPAARVAEFIGWGYDWSPDSRKLLFIKNDTALREEMVPGTLATRNIVGDDGKLDVQQVTLKDHFDGISTHYFHESFDELAGVMFTPFSRARYHSSGRILFSAMAMQFPTSRLEEGRISLYFYDPVMKSVTDLLPYSVSSQLNANAANFALSPDGTRLLLPTNYHRFIIYRIGQSDGKTPLTEKDGFGDDGVFDMVPSWKGNDQLSCLVDAKCHLLPHVQGHEYADREILILNRDGEFVSHLSAGWKDAFQEPAESSKGDDPNLVLDQ